MMLSGVGKSGSPISRWMTLRPCASRLRALARTSKAPSVPMLSIRWANLIVNPCSLSKDAPAGGAVDDDGLPADVAGAARAEEGADRGELRRLAVAPHRHPPRVPLQLLLQAHPRLLRRRPGDGAGAVGQDRVGGEAVDGDAVPGQ